jgi:hypothetical protein
MVENIEDDSKPELPAKFDVNKWVSWSKKIENYLWQLKGPNNIPLVYVIRKTRAADAPPFVTVEEERMYQTTHTGPAFTRDNQKVWGILHQLLGRNPAYTWISRYEGTKNGKAAYQALRVHFDGPGESMKRNNHAYKILENTHYKSERLFMFENYVTKLSEAFEILEDNGMGKNELERVKILLDGIQSDNQTVISAKTTIMMNDTMRMSFQVAVDRLSEFIGATFSGNTSYNGKRAARNVSRMETGHGRGQGRFGRGGCGSQGGRGGNRAGGKQHNGVDITDLTRSFTGEEWQKLSPEIIQQIKNAREAAKNENKKRKVAAVGNSADDEADKHDQAEADLPTDNVASNGNNFGSGAYNTRAKQVGLMPTADKTAD